MKKLLKRIFSSDKPNEDKLEELSVEDSLLKELRTKFPKEMAALNNLLVSEGDLSYKYFLILLVRFYRKVYSMPASEKHHHKEDFGLIQHTLQTIAFALQEYNFECDMHYNKKGTLDVQFNYMNKERIIFTIAIKALVHDAGKIYDLDVTASDGSNSQFSYVFDATYENLYDFIKAHPNYNLQWKRGRGKQHEHDKRSILMFCELIRETDKKYMNTINFFRIVNELLGFDSDNIVKEIVSIADKQSTATAISKNPPPERDPEESKEDYDIRRFFVNAVSNLIERGIFHVNKLSHDIISTPGVTLLSYPDATNRAIRQASFMYQINTKPEHIVKLMQAKNMLITTKDGNPLIKVGYRENVGDNNLVMTKKGVYIAIKNKFIWGIVTPAVYPGELKMELEDEPDITEIKEEIAAARPLTPAEKAQLKAEKTATVPSINANITADVVVQEPVQSQNEAKKQEVVADAVTDKAQDTETVAETETIQSPQNEDPSEIPASAEQAQKDNEGEQLPEKKQTPVKKSVEAQPLPEPEPEPEQLSPQETEGEEAPVVKVPKCYTFLEALKDILSKGGTKDVFESTLDSGEEVVVVTMPKGILEVVVNIPFEQRTSEWRVYINSMDSKSMLFKTSKSPTCKKLEITRDDEVVSVTEAIVIFKYIAGLSEMQ